MMKQTTRSWTGTTISGRKTAAVRARSLGVALSIATTVPMSGCMALTPQLPPTDYAAIEGTEDRGERERLYRDNQIVVHEAPQGRRYTKGTSPLAEPRSWQSLDKILRSDSNSAAALPDRTLRTSRVFTALTIAASMVTVAGVAASAREGLDLRNPTAGGGMLLGGGIAALAFGITAGVLYGRAQKGYQRSVEIYNDSLAMRLGLSTPQGAYIPPKGVLVDDQGFILMSEPERKWFEDDAEETPVGPDPATPPDASTPPTPAPSSPSSESPDASQDAASPPPAPQGSIPQAPAPQAPVPSPPAPPADSASVPNPPAPPSGLKSSPTVPASPSEPKPTVPASPSGPDSTQPANPPAVQPGPSPAPQLGVAALRPRSGGFTATPDTHH